MLSSRLYEFDAGHKQTLAPRSLEPYFFLPAIGFAGPLRVRALVCVR